MRQVLLRLVKAQLARPFDGWLALCGEQQQWLAGLQKVLYRVNAAASSKLPPCPAPRQPAPPRVASRLCWMMPERHCMSTRGGQAFANWRAMHARNAVCRRVLLRLVKVRAARPPARPPAGRSARSAARRVRR